MPGSVIKETFLSSRHFCTNLQLGNMNVFIHCVLAISNHPDNNLKSCTGKVGSGSLCLRSDPHCHGLEQLPGDVGAPEIPSPHPTPGVRMSPTVLSSELFPVPGGLQAQCPSQGWVRHQSQWPDPGGTSSRRPKAPRFMDAWNGTSSSFASKMACKVFSFSFPHVREKSYKASIKIPLLKRTGLF